MRRLNLYKPVSRRGLLVVTLLRWEAYDRRKGGKVRIDETNGVAKKIKLNQLVSSPSVPSCVPCRQCMSVSYEVTNHGHMAAHQTLFYKLLDNNGPRPRQVQN